MRVRLKVVSISSDAMNEDKKTPQEKDVLDKSAEMSHSEVQ